VSPSRPLRRTTRQQVSPSLAGAFSRCDAHAPPPQFRQATKQTELPGRARARVTTAFNKMLAIIGRRWHRHIRPRRGHTRRSAMAGRSATWKRVVAGPGVDGDEARSGLQSSISCQIACSSCSSQSAPGSAMAQLVHVPSGRGGGLPAGESRRGLPIGNGRSLLSQASATSRSSRRPGCTRPSQLVNPRIRVDPPQIRASACRREGWTPDLAWCPLPVLP